jgi:hypothetical protein
VKDVTAGISDTGGQFNAGENGRPWSIFFGENDTAGTP